MFIYIDETGDLDEELKEDYFGIGAIVLSKEVKDLIEKEYFGLKNKNCFPDDDIRIINLGKKGTCNEEQRIIYTEWLFSLLEKLSLDEFQFLFEGEDLSNKEWIKYNNEKLHQFMKSDPVYSSLYKEFSSGIYRKDGRPSINVNGYSSYIHFMINNGFFALVDICKTRHENSINSLYIGIDEVSRKKQNAVLNTFNETYKMNKESVLLTEKIQLPLKENVKIDFIKSKNSCLLAIVDNLTLMKRKDIHKESYRRLFRNYKDKVENSLDFSIKYLIRGHRLKNTD